MSTDNVSCLWYKYLWSGVGGDNYIIQINVISSHYPMQKKATVLFLH